MFAAGLPALRLAMLPSEVPKDQHDVVAMAGKTFWSTITHPPEQVEADFKALVAAYPSFPNVHYFYGTYLAVHHPEQSVTEFLAELKVQPDSVPARVQLALHFINVQKPADALKYAREAVELSPESVGAQLALAEALKAGGDDQGALAAYQTAEKLDPDSATVRLYLVNAYRAVGRKGRIRSPQKGGAGLALSSLLDPRLFGSSSPDLQEIRSTAQELKPQLSFLCHIFNSVCSAYIERLRFCRSSSVFAGFLGPKSPPNAPYQNRKLLVSFLFS
jgi:tetratricopeptide (TPR) repeat protein